MYRRNSGWSANPPGTGAHLASGNHSVIAYAVLLWDWTYPMIGIRIKGLMDSARLALTQSGSEMLGKQIRFFMCRDAFFA